MEIVDDDEIRPADCKVDTSKSRALAEMLHTVGRLEKSKSVPHVKLLGPEFKPRAVLQAVKSRAVNGARAVLACIDRPTQRLVFIWADDAHDNAYRLANLKAARGFVLGALVFNPDQSIDRYAEQEESELKTMLLDFYARIIERGQSPEAAFDALLALVRDRDFLAQTQARRALDEFVQSNENAPIDENALACFDALKDKFPEIAKILDGDPSDFNFQH